MKILVFGGGSDIGETLKELITEGEVVYLSKRQVDVRKKLAVQRAIFKHRPDAIVNCAGVSYTRSVPKSTPADWEEEINVNLLGSYYIAHYGMRAGVPCYVFLVSVAGLYGKPNHSGYSASKAGVRSLVQSMAMEGVRAYAISPGRVNTKMREKDYPGEDIRTRLDPREVGDAIKSCIEGKAPYLPGDNVIIRRIGYETQPLIFDAGEPWKTDLKVGQPPMI